MNIDYFANVNIFIEENKEITYIVKFKNLIDGLCIFGGFMNSLMTIGMIIVYPINWVNYKKEVINKIFDFEEENSQFDGRNEMK